MNNKSIMLRLSENEYNQLVLLAKNNNISVNKLIRSCLDLVIFSDVSYHKDIKDVVMSLSIRSDDRG